MIKRFRKYVKTFKQILKDVNNTLELESSVEKYLKLEDGLKKEVEKSLIFKKHINRIHDSFLKKYFKIVGVESELINDYTSKEREEKEIDIHVLKFFSRKNSELERILRSTAIASESREKKDALLDLNARNEDFHKMIEVELGHPGFEHEYFVIFNKLMKKISIPEFKAWIIINNSYNAFKNDLKDYQFKNNLKEIEKLIPEKSSELTGLLKRGRHYTKKLAGEYDNSVKKSNPKSYFI